MNANLDNNWVSIVLLVLLVVMVVANVFLKGRKMEKSPIGKMMVIYMDLNSNKRVLESFGVSRRYKKFKTSAWKRNRNKLDFLPHELQTSLADAFDMAEDYNQRIAAANKFASSSYMAGIDVEKMRKPFEQTVQEIHTWIQENMDDPELAPKKRGLFGF